MLLRALNTKHAHGIGQRCGTGRSGALTGLADNLYIWMSVKKHARSPSKEATR